jgi:hypothetical protein
MGYQLPTDPSPFGSAYGLSGSVGCVDEDEPSYSLENDVPGRTGPAGSISRVTPALETISSGRPGSYRDPLLFE